MDVKLLVSLVSQDKSYAPGDSYPCSSPEEAQSLIAAGYAVAANDPPVKKKK